MKKLLWPLTKTQIQNLPLEAVSVLVDPREQQPWDLSPMKVEEATLQTGDYCSACRRFVLERKNSIDELVSCMTQSRDRFERELERMQAFEAAVVLVEGTYQELVNGDYRSKMNKNSAAATFVSWQQKFWVPIHFVGNRSNAEEYAKRFFHLQHRRRLSELLHYYTLSFASETSNPS